MRNNNKDSVNRLFFALLRAGLWEKDVNLLPHGEIDFSEIYDLAEEQSVVGIIAAGLEHVIDMRFAKKDVVQFIGRTVYIEQKNHRMNDFLADLMNKMQKAGIYALLVKGQGVAQCYERPMWRSSGDVDLFLSDENYEKAKCFLLPLATHVENEYKSVKHLGLTIDPWVIELHGSLRMGIPRRINRVLDEIGRDTFDGDVRTWDNGNSQFFLLSKENDVVYVFVHFFNHFYKGGLGLRQICDWCRLMWTFRETLDAKKVESLIKKMGLVNEWKAFASLVVDYLGMDSSVIPMYEDAPRWKKKAARIRDFVMSVGNMGHNRDMNYYSKYPYLIRKCLSMSQRVSDLIRHSRVFPSFSLLFFPTIMINGLRGAVNGE